MEFTGTGFTGPTGDDIEQRLTAAAQEVRQHDLDAERCANLAGRRDAN